MSPSSSPCRSSGNHSQRLFQKTIEGLEVKINGQAFEAALRHCLLRSDRQHKHRVIPSLWQLLLAATCSLEENVLPLLLYHSCYTDLVQELKRLSYTDLVQELKRLKVVMLCRYQTMTTDFFSLEMKFPWNRLEVVADQSSAHRFAQSCDHSLVSE